MRHRYRPIAVAAFTIGIVIALLAALAACDGADVSLEAAPAAASHPAALAAPIHPAAAIRPAVVDDDLTDGSSLWSSRSSPRTSSHRSGFWGGLATPNTGPEPAADDPPDTTAPPQLSTTTSIATTTTAPPTPAPTTTAPTTTPPASPPPPSPPPTTAPSATDGPSAWELNFLSCVRWRESRGNYTVVSANGLYYGAYQFLRSTWDNTARHAGRADLIGMAPNLASPGDQDAMALHLLRWQGTSPWGGVCG